MSTERRYVNCITINTDASFHPTELVGGYAFYIVCDLFKIKKGDVFKIPPKNAEEAEIMCIGNAISALLAVQNLPRAKWLVINSDCKWGMEKIRTSNGELAKKVNKLYSKLINVLCSRKNKFRHVKSHSGVDDARSHVNEFCDRVAKDFMREALRLKCLNNTGVIDPNYDKIGI